MLAKIILKPPFLLSMLSSRKCIELFDRVFTFAVGPIIQKIIASLKEKKTEISTIYLKIGPRLRGTFFTVHTFYVHVVLYNITKENMLKK